MEQKNQTTTSFSAFFRPDDVLCRTPLTNRDDVLKELLARLARNRGVGDVDAAFDGVLERENSRPTIVAPGVAMPHARVEGLTDLVVGIATSARGIEFAPGEQANLVIVILAPKEQPGLYLQAISSLAAVCIRPSISQTIAALETADDVWRFFDRGGVVLKNVVRAGDIMVPSPVCIRDTDTLKDAIDLLVSHNLIDLPVVDHDGDLVGSVSSYELLRVCLPDYVLWMDDLSPIMNFEPFANILRHESNTWLAEIMSREFVVVSEDEPAVQVAKEMTKAGARQAYVTRGKSLVGIITLQHFLYKVLRE